MTESDQEQAQQPDEQASEQAEGGAEQERARPRSGGRARAADRGGDQVATEPATADEAPAPAEDPVSVIAAGGHLDASGNGCYCDRGGGHAPLTEDERSAYANQERTEPAPPPSEQPLSAEERAELEKLRAERAARART